jgi:hypothetical protein
MAWRLGLDPGNAASMVQRVGSALGEFVSADEIEHVKSQLPGEMKMILPDPPRSYPMPDKETIRRARKDKAQGKSASTQAGEFIREEIHHVREGKHGARSTKQAIAIGLSKARRAGVALPPPEPGTTSEETRKTAKREYNRARGGRKRHATSQRRSRASLRRLKRYGRKAASPQALSRHAHKVASQRTARERSASARKAVRTKGAAGRKRAAKKAARTRAAG